MIEYKAGDRVTVHWPSPEGASPRDKSVGFPGGYGEDGFGGGPPRPESPTEATIARPFTWRDEVCYTVTFPAMGDGQGNTYDTWTCRAGWFEPTDGPW